MKNTIFILFILSLIASSCSKKLKTINLTSIEAVDEMAVIKSDKKEKCNCLDPEAYIPDDRFPEFQDLKYVKVNFHFPNASNKKYNWTGDEAVTWAQKLVNACNYQLINNIKMNLPEGNNTPVYDAGYRMELMEDKSTPSGMAVYEDVDDENWYYIKKGKGKNNYSKTIIKKFAIDEEHMLNFFAMAYPPDSLKVKGFSSGRAGIALGTSLKVAGVRKYPMKEVWKFASVSNHEIGHVFGLRHSWYKNDGCDDTPAHPNCWASTESGKCKGVISNNMMDYNNIQRALSPCQIGTVMRTMHKENAKVRGLVKKDWCEYNPNKTLVIRKDLELNRAIDMKGDIILEKDVTLRLSCRTHMPAGAKIIVKPGATLVLNGAKIHNDCGQSWGGFDLQSNGTKKGTIVYLGEVEIENLPKNPSEESDSE